MWRKRNLIPYLPRQHRDVYDGCKVTQGGGFDPRAYAAIECNLVEVL